MSIVAPCNLTLWRVYRRSRPVGDQWRAWGPCVLGPPCPTRGEAVLAPTVVPGYSSFGLEDTGESFSATGSATFLSSGNVGGPPPGRPEPTTWAMMLIGFVGHALAAYRPRRQALVHCR